MNTDTRIFSNRAPTPWHLWVIGVVTLLWNAMGAFDFVATQIQLEGYMDAFSQEQLDYFYSFPTWLIVAWAIAIWSAVFGSLALLFRSRFAYPLFMISLLAMIVTSVHNFGLSNGAEIMGTTGVIFSAVIALVSILLVFYSRAMVRRRVLT